MGKIKKNQIRVSFVGGNAEDVTGSMTLIESKDFKILFECGLIQSNNVKSDYYSNKRKLTFKPKEIDYIFLGHFHADHSLLIPRLVAEGFQGRIIAPVGTSKFFNAMALDSAFIMSKDVETLSNKYGLDVFPIYTSDDVADTMPLFEEHEINQVIELNDYITFKFIPSGHIICACQCEMWLKCGSQTKKIVFTSDLGNVSCPKPFTLPLSRVDKANLVVAETTYGDNKRAVGIKDREKDLEKIYSVITDVCIERKSKVLIPIFSLDRCQLIMLLLYRMFKDDKSFEIPIIVDSPLAQKMCKLYCDTLVGDDLKLWREVMCWKNFKYPAEYCDSKAFMESDEPCVALAASGFMAAGRSRQWAKVLLPNHNAQILFVGYSSENALAGKIKYGNAQKTISIDGKQYRNRCGVTDLKSFTSHMQRNDMLDYYSSINCERICLVHGDMKGKLEFAEALKNEVSKRDRSTKIICVNKSTEILL